MQGVQVQVLVRVQGAPTHLIRFTAAEEGVDDGDAGVQRRHAGARLVRPVDHDVVCTGIGVGGSAGLHTLQLAEVPRLGVNNLQKV